MRERKLFEDVKRRLQMVSEPTRRLDAEVMCLASGPDTRINPVEDLDGWGLDRLADGRREHLLASEDVPYLTRYLDAATEVVARARPQDGASIIHRALQHRRRPVKPSPSRRSWRGWRG